MSNNQPDYLEEDSIFVRKIEKDGNICKTCYRKLREHTESMHDLATSITEYEEHADFSYFDDFTHTGRPNIQKAYCKCGSVDWNDIRIRPLDMEQIMDAGKRIANHLEEKGYEVDRSKLLSHIEDNAPLPENQYKEEKVLENAVEKSVIKEE